ncbi:MULTISPECIES: hypothetical protein, partial [unclassified Paraburkholderia]|uniref:hypothetical protein n=1 Tax=unclassified Paraburkholderia TaxID=2615204 RepID=UPI002AB681D3
GPVPLLSASRKATVAVSGVFGVACVFIVILLSVWLSGLRRDVVQPMERRIRIGRYLRNRIV